MTTTLDTHTWYDDDDDGSVYNNNDTGTRWNEGRGCKQVTRRREHSRNTRPMAYAYVPHIPRHTQRGLYTPPQVPIGDSNRFQPEFYLAVSLPN
ncbi:hypothetical protein CVT25_005369 [Psilocybe cyanescens]|uniref:Uncharacterized protein n=1 Tax=Psilocybe cyanescens TaxID=93625 RepID=A0A409XRT3_PSICY|nr:hypothetical protein CVT25_005369 [Psilocybe cyanescens]